MKKRLDTLKTTIAAGCKEVIAKLSPAANDKRARDGEGVGE